VVANPTPTALPPFIAASPRTLQLNIQPQTNGPEVNGLHTHDFCGHDEDEDGTTQGGYGEWGHVVNRGARTIIPDLKHLMFPDDIKNRADLIYNQMAHRVRRGKIRSQLLFWCVYQAHRELGRKADPIGLGAKFGLTQGDVSKCDSIFSELQTGYRPPVSTASPIQYLPDYCARLGIQHDGILQIMTLAGQILQKDPGLLQDNPQTVAAGVLRYFIITNGITMDDSTLIAKVTNRSNVTIDNMYRRISTIDNQ
jgi:transcription initiation factor TFIIIB Brf1 subunit/transcription initiation factor TFIIB